MVVKSSDTSHDSPTSGVKLRLAMSKNASPSLRNPPPSPHSAPNESPFGSSPVTVRVPP